MNLFGILENLDLMKLAIFMFDFGAGSAFCFEMGSKLALAQRIGNHAFLLELRIVATQSVVGRDRLGRDNATH